MAEQFYQLEKRYAEEGGVSRGPQKALALWKKAAARRHSYAQEILKWNKLFDECSNFLNLDKKQIGEQGAIAIAEALKVNHILISLRLSDNQIGDQGAVAIAEALKVNQTLASLDLGSNQIWEQGACTIAEALKVNQTLTSLNLLGNQIGIHNAKACDEIKSQNRSLQNSAFQAAQEGNARLFDFLDKGVSLYSYDRDNNTFLHIAAAHGHMHLIQPLLERSHNPTFSSWKNTKGKTALDLAREKGHTAIVELLTTRG